MLRPSILALLSLFAVAGSASADMRGEALAAHNAARKRAGLRPLLIHARLNAAAHRDNVLSADWRDVGFGKAVGRDGRVYWCAVYGRPMKVKR